MSKTITSFFIFSAHLLVCSTALADQIEVYPSPAPSTPILRNSIVKEALPTTADNNSVQSFFQCGTVQNLGDNNSTIHKTQNKSLIKTTGSVMWHILDNLGVPLFIGKDNDLDPSIDRNSYGMPPLNLPATVIKIKKTNTVNKITPETTPQPSLSTPEVPPTTPQKIPQSELEGVELPAPKDAQTP